MFAYYSQWIPLFSHLTNIKSIPLLPLTILVFKDLRHGIINSAVMAIDFSALLMVGTEALEYSIVTSQSQSSFLAPFFFP